MRKLLKIMTIAAVVIMATALTPAIGQAASNAKTKQMCMDMANMIAAAMAQTGGNQSKEILALFGAGMQKASGKATATDTELLWVAKVAGHQTTTHVKIYTALRMVRVETKAETLGIFESASAKY